MKLKPFHAHDKAARTRIVGNWSPDPGRGRSARLLSLRRAMRKAGAR